MEHVINDLELINRLYTLVAAVSKGYKVDIETAKQLVIKSLMDNRLNILEIITEHYELL